MKVLVTGATGYLGSAAARSLRAHGHTVVGTTRSNPGSLRAASVVPVVAALEEPDSLVAAMSGVDAVVHTAFSGSGDLAAASAAETAAVSAMLDAAGSRRFVYTSGIGVIGPTGDTAVGESDPIAMPGFMKWRRDLELATLAAGGAVIRPGLVYGHAGGLMLKALIAAAVESGVSRYVTPGDTAWPHVHVDDVGALTALALTAPAASILHAVAGHSTPREVAEAIARLIGHPPAVGLPLDEARGVIPHADWFGTHQHVSATHTRSLGWQPKGPALHTDLEHGTYRSLLP